MFHRLGAAGFTKLPMVDSEALPSMGHRHTIPHHIRSRTRTLPVAQRNRPFPIPGHTLEAPETGTSHITDDVG